MGTFNWDSACVHVAKIEKMPEWISNDPAPDYTRSRGQARRKCLNCRSLTAKPGLCLKCFFKFWEDRLQHQYGKWKKKDRPRYLAGMMDNLPGETAQRGEIEACG